jgi:hypothetical protein
MPFPNDGTGAEQGSKKRKISPQKSSKTAPSPGGEQEPPTSQARKEELGLQTVKSLKFGDGSDKNNNVAAPKTDETMPLNASIESSYMQTESQQRRERMADCEFECSRITSYLFVGGYHIATNREILRQNGITHIVNCSAAVVENTFINDSTLRYLSLSMVDGRQDDISWFLCEVVQFIMKARAQNGKILIHCEKGISRSCSFAIAYRMWATGDKWKTCFDFVKKGRSICSPNTAFTCNLIELGELLGKDAAKTGAGGNLLFRCAYHLPHDPQTAVLKMCRTSDSRKIMVPATSLLDPKGVFVIRTVRSNDEGVQNSADQHRLFLWQGAEASDATRAKAEALAKKMHGVLTTTDVVEIVKQGEENFEFLSYLVEDGIFNSSDNSIFDDFFDYPPSEEQTLQSVRQMEADHTRNNEIFNRPTPARESSIKGFAEFQDGPMSRESSVRLQGTPHLSRESSTRRGSGGNMDLLALGTRRASGSTQLNLNLDAASAVTIGSGASVTSPSSSVRKDSESKVDESPSSSNNNSRRNSDMVASFTKIPSLKLNTAEVMSSINEEKLVGGAGAAGLALSPDNATGKKRGVPELSLAAKPGTLQQMQRVSEGELNSSEPNSSRISSSRDQSPRDLSGEIRGAVPVFSEGAVTPLVKQNSVGKTILPAIQLPGLQLQKSISPKPALLALNLGAKSNDQNSSSPASQVSVPKLQRNGSEERVKPNVLAVPLNMYESPRAGNSRPTSATMTHPATAGLLNGHSPLTERRMSGAAASVLALAHGTNSNNNSAANLHAVLPLKVLERSPSQERHPLDVGLSRGPTPIEDLSNPADLYSPRANLFLPSTAEPANLRPSGSKANGVVTLVKPLLFQAVPKEVPDIPRPGKRSSGTAVRYEWQAMGVYDDEDLDEVRHLLCTLKLLCLSTEYTLTSKRTLLFSSCTRTACSCCSARAARTSCGTARPSPRARRAWTLTAPRKTSPARRASSSGQPRCSPEMCVSRTPRAAACCPTLKFPWKCTCARFLSALMIVYHHHAFCLYYHYRGGEETEEFWQDFNDGF